MLSLIKVGFYSTCTDKNRMCYEITVIILIHNYINKKIIKMEKYLIYLFIIITPFVYSISAEYNRIFHNQNMNNTHKKHHQLQSLTKLQSITVHFFFCMYVCCKIITSWGWGCVIMRQHCPWLNTIKFSCTN